MNNTRPTFGINNSTVNKTTEKRVESGCIWRRNSKRTNEEFLSIQIKFSKERLKLLLSKEGDTVDLGFVAFTNNTKNEGSKHPDFRVYENKENE